MKERTRNTLLIGFAVVFVALLVAWWYSGFSLDFMRFFAAEPGVIATCQPRPACLDAKPPCDIAEPADGWCRPVPSGCFYQDVQCFQAPCPSILVCPSGTPGGRMVSCAPATQTVKVGAPATLTAAGGAGLYVWYSPEGNPSNTVDASFRTNGNGSPLSVTYSVPGTKKVTVSSPRAPNDPANPVVDYVACTVVVVP